MASSGSRLSSSGLTGYAVPNGKLVAACAGNALTIAIKTAAGNDASPIDPLYVAFRNDPSSGSLLEGRTLTTAASVTIPNGKAFGSFANIGFRIWVVLFDDAEIYRLGAIMCSWITTAALGSQIAMMRPLTEYGIADSIVSSSASSSGFFYTDTSTVSSKPFRIIGFVDFNNGLAGTAWNVQPDVVQMFGPGMHLPGELVSSLVNMDYFSGPNATGYQIPLDNTIPQSSEGITVVQRAFRASSKVNIIHNRAHIPFSLDEFGIHVSAAWFKDLETDARGANAVYVSAVDAMTTLTVDMIMQAGTLSEITFEHKIGPSNNTAVLTIGGRAGASLFNGQNPVVTEMREIMI